MVKKIIFGLYVKKIKSVFEHKMKNFFTEDSHSLDNFILHASHIMKKKRLQPNF